MAFQYNIYINSKGGWVPPLAPPSSQIRPCLLFSSTMTLPAASQWKMYLGSIRACVSRVCLWCDHNGKFNGRSLSYICASVCVYSCLSMLKMSQIFLMRSIMRVMPTAHACIHTFVHTYIQRAHMHSALTRASFRLVDYIRTYVRAYGTSHSNFNDLLWQANERTNDERRTIAEWTSKRTLEPMTP